MINVLRLLGISIGLFLASCSSGDEPDSISSRLSHINLKWVLKEQAENHSIPAVAIGVFNTDSIITCSYGVKGINNCVPIDMNDKFNIGSCTKSFTSFLAARLIKTGIIKYETTIEEIFGSDNHINPYYLDKTLADLLSHRAGIQPFIKEEEFKRIPAEISDKNKDDNRQLFSEWVLTLDPVIDKQQSYIYSNAGYSVAATMMEKVTRKSWESLMTEAVFKPLKIDGWFGFPHLYSDNQPRGHINLAEYDTKAANELIQFPDSSSYDLNLIDPAGGVTLTIYEHAVFLQELLRGLQGKGSLLTNKEYEALLTSSAVYSNGWLQLKTNNVFYLSHEGSNGTFYACAILCKQLDYGMVILVNSGTKETIAGIYNIINMIDTEFR